mgnify:CR=1 FL=1
MRNKTIERKSMQSRKILTVIMTALVVSMLSACGSSNTSVNINSSGNSDISANSTTSGSGKLESTTEESKTDVYVTPTVENGEIAIDADTLTSDPIYVNYDSNGTNIQLIAVKASDGTPRLSLNTCQVCNPSPRAYFKEQDGKLVCQNCGNTFTMDSVGETSGGCNPTYIDYKNADGKLTVSTADLDTYVDRFTSWGGPVK